MAGVPLLNGFLSKEMFFAETAVRVDNPFVNLALPIGATIAGVFSVTYSLRFVHDVFFGPPPDNLDRTPHEPPRWMRWPVEVLVMLCLVVGILPGVTIGPFLATAVRSVTGKDTPEYSLSVWHGFNLPLAMSAVALVGGGLLYLALNRRLASIEEPPLMRRIKGKDVFELVLVTVFWRWASALKRFFGTERLQPQLFLLVLVAVLAGAATLAGRLGSFSFSAADLEPAFALVWMVGIACAVMSAYQAKFHRLVSLVLMGGAGLVTCITFVWFSAPDLAVTQLLVEIVTTVLILLGLRWLPKRFEEVGRDRHPNRTRARRARDLVLAIVAGVGMALIAYAMMTRPSLGGISSYFLENAYRLGGGTNVVNVMLVDFRGFDTLGEITVLGIVALTVFALLRRFRPAAESVDKPEQQRVQKAHAEREEGGAEGDAAHEFLRIPSVLMRWMFPVAIVLTLHIFMRGHDKPGGGFAAGIVMSIAFILQYMADGTRWVEDRLRIRPVAWIGAGLFLALGTGAASWLFGRPFLTTAFQYADIPLIGKVPLASALLFDLGVFALVVGATVLILIALAHQSVRKPRKAPSVEPGSIDAAKGGTR